MQKLLASFKKANVTLQPRLQQDYDSYQRLYLEQRKNRKRSNKILEAIYGSIDGLSEFILVEIGMNL